VPTITVSVPAVVIMVPELTADRAVSYLSTGETIWALDYGSRPAWWCWPWPSASRSGCRPIAPTDRTWGLEH
jgi:hypothetical protein